MKKISVIIPCYNASETLPRCLDSVFSQTYENFEVIAVNDGSKDDTLKVLLKYQAKHSNLKILNKNNAGVSQARNDGLKLASGELIQFIDSDDNFLFDDVLERLVNKMEEHDVDVVTFNFTHPAFFQYLPEGVYDLRDEKQFIAYYQDFFTSMMPWNKLFKKELITRGYHPELRFAEDEIFNLDNLQNIKKVYVISEVLHNYYCQDPEEKTSAINQTLAATKFWETNTTIWFLGETLVPHRDRIFTRDYPALRDRLMYVRSFDFFLFDMTFMMQAKVPAQHIYYELKRIFPQQNFIHSMNAKQSEGIYLKQMTDEELSANLKAFIAEAYESYQFLKANKRTREIHFASLKLFGTYFCEFEERAKHSIDALAQAYFAAV